jgi:hypothetical protein
MDYLFIYLDQRHSPSFIRKRIKHPDPMLGTPAYKKVFSEMPTTSNDKS